MKNNSILAFLLLLGSFHLSAQDSKFRLGLRFAPNIAMTRVQDASESDSITYKSNGAGVRFSGGLTGDFYFGKNYSFYTGLWYTVQRIGIEFSETSRNKISGSSIHNLQYVQVPIALKLFTNNIATDTKLYFVLGLTAGLKINEKEKEWSTENEAPEKKIYKKPGIGNAFSLFDAGLLVGIGGEKQLGENTTVFAGLSYNRGLTSVQTKKGPFSVDGKSAKDAYKVTTSLLSIEAGIKF
jgi:hypothetical protein